MIHELRLGNYVMMNNATYRVYELGVSVVALVSGEIELDTALVDEIEPILLTVEWLEKLGFDFDGKYYYIQPEFDNIHYRVTEFPPGCWIVSKGFINYNHELTTPRYLHQLQNLIYILSGHELTLKP